MDRREPLDLRAHRALVEDACGHEPDGLATAVCISDRFATTFAQGPPRHEFVDPDFDPARDLRDHLAGAPGHCMTRAAQLATSLLSVGVAARVVQTLPPRSDGHTMTELYDPTHGWVVFDPSSGALLTARGAPASVRELASLPESERMGWLLVGVEPRASPGAERYFGRGDRFRGVILYPEPWSYTRVGDRIAMFPFRAAFRVVQGWRRVGAPHWSALVRLLAILVLLVAGMACEIGVSRAGGTA